MNSQHPLVTVFMAAYNTEKYISLAIQSILNQTYSNFELLIIDDCSTDNTLYEIKKFEDSRIRLLQNGCNQGVVITRNRALAEANGAFIAVMDSDDIAVPDRIESLLNEFKAHPEYALIGGHADVIDPYGIPTGQQFTVETEPSLLRYRLLLGNNFTHSSIMMRTEVFREFNGYRTPLAEDYDLFLRISTKYPVGNLDKVLIFYRDHASGISKKYAQDLYNQVLPIKENILRSLRLPADISYQKMITHPINWDEINIAAYKKLHADLLDRIYAPPHSSSTHAKRFIFQRWYEVIMNNGGKMTIFYFFNRPFFGWRYFTAKQFRRALKNSVKNLFK
ncbi:MULTISPECIES: glycosyltransferase family 2 protein [Sphingobacterium]|uniref:glycosyltransferase family 2 protein n=1 Tax=Sphingobacterium TaxID=28453 RepID=UPI0013E50D51|nr:MULTISPECIES: glycosyltransferase [Sphingobacterium]QIH36265.1 glycosyltransferase [Sphingobacterium sp. DR205]